ncbi:hypothetical protein E3N88_14345 [Mikania micrantha]|uniref:Uncharacterized protein n=1 Tax=Mikania micrantha TaxID=192012 RepID=A0A5N6P492_9ASTR|nr:hypothetical protein E3N88_14345 [Mikania micrantha]
MSQNIPENIQRDAPIIESASDEATPLDQRLSPKSPGSYHPEMPPTHTITQAQGTSAIAVPDPEPIMSEVDPSSSEGVNAGEAATTVDLNQGLQDSGTGTKTSHAETLIGEDFFEALLNEGNPGCQETTIGDGGAGARLRTPSPSDSIPIDEGTKTKKLTDTISSLQAKVAQLEAEVATLRLEVQVKDATILDLRRRPLVILQPFHPDPATTSILSPNATKKGENVPSTGSRPEVREEEDAQEVNPSIVTLTTEWDDFFSTYFHVSSTTPSSSSEDTREVAKETEQHTTNESPKMVGQLEEAVNAEVNSEAAVASEGPVIIDDSSTEELLANEPVGEATGSVSSRAKLTANDKEKRKLTPEEEAEQEERIPKKMKGRPDTAQDEERIRLSALLEEKGYDFDAVLLWSVPQMVAELDKVQQQEQAAAASKAQKKLTKTQKDKAYRDNMKAFLLEYGFHARQLGPMKNSTMDMHVRDIKAKIARGELLPIEQIRAQRSSLIRGLGLGGGARIEIPLSGTGIREGEEVMCGEATKAMFPKMFPLNPKEEQTSPPSSPSMDNMPISLVIKINKGKKTTRKQPSLNLDPERQTQADERRTETSITEDADPQPTATTGAAVGSNMEDHYNRVHQEFTLSLLNGGIKVVTLAQLIVLAAPFVFDLENLHLDNPDDGLEGRQALRWVKARAQVLRGEKVVRRVP